MVVITSLAPVNIFKSAGMNPQSAPKSPPRAKEIITWIIGGRPVMLDPTTAAAKAPIKNCPSIPILKIPERKAKRKDNEVKSIGVAWVSVCPTANLLPKAPRKSAAKARMG